MQQTSDLSREQIVELRRLAVECARITNPQLTIGVADLIAEASLVYDYIMTGKLPKVGQVESYPISG